MRHKRAKTMWIREYEYRGKTYAIKKYVAPVGWRNKRVKRYAVSKSPKRKSWYTDFRDFSTAKRFGITLVKY